MAASSSSDTENASDYLILDPSKGSNGDIVRYLVKNDLRSGMKFLNTSTEDVRGQAVVAHRMLVLLSVILIRFLNLLEKPVKYLGYASDFILNFLNQNGGFSGIIYNLFHGKLMIPKRGEDNFLSTMGLLDERIDLYRSILMAEQVDNIEEDIANIKAPLGNRYLMDLCMMASKLAYESEAVVKKVVNDYWQMHFEAFYNCWNDRQKADNTQVFIFLDKPQDANLIIVSFRGTEVYDVQDWITDLDFSWYEIQKVGKVHIGFLESLGMGTRDDATSFEKYFQKKNTGIFQKREHNEATDSDKIRAYFVLTDKIKSLLKEHKHAKFVMTGHSLGAALAIMYPCLLFVLEEKELLDKLLNVYTFGQPRIGDEKLASFMESRFNYPDTRYFRMVYCNDLIPRVPFDDNTFSFKHFGTCLYYDSLYYGKFMDEQPNKNYFKLGHFIPMSLNAVYELIRSFFIKYIHGQQYEETWLNTMFRLQGLVVPGISAHMPVDYINAIRLGRARVAPTTSLKSFARRI